MAGRVSPNFSGPETGQIQKTPPVIEISRLQDVKSGLKPYTKKSRPRGVLFLLPRDARLGSWPATASACTESDNFHSHTVRKTVNESPVHVSHRVRLESDLPLSEAEKLVSTLRPESWRSGNVNDDDLPRL